MNTIRIFLSVLVMSGAVGGAGAFAYTPTPTPTATLSPTPTPDPGPTPPPLANAQNPVDYGADPTGAANSAAAFQSAINAGDLDVPAGIFRIDGSVNIVDNTNIRCEPGAVLRYTT